MTTIGKQDREPLLKILEEAGVPATPVNTVDQEHTDEILAELGYAPADITTLRSKKVVK